MPVLRRRRSKLTAAQRIARKEWRAARTLVQVLATGIGEELKRIYDREDLDDIMLLVNGKLSPAIQAMELADKLYEQSKHKAHKKAKAAA